MDLNALREERSKCFTWKNIEPKYKALTKFIKSVESDVEYELGDTVKIKGELNETQKELLVDACKHLMPWRKGPFELFDLFIDTEWKSNIKYNLIRPYFDLKNKIVADVGCNNGYYLFRMLEDDPKKIVGFDPSILYSMQFDLINSLIKSKIKYEMLGVEHIEHYDHKFDFIFMLGVLYHRPDPVGCLKSLAKALNKNGEILIDTFMIDGEEEVALTPKKTYSKIPNIYFVPTIPALKNWLDRAGFTDIEVLEITKTDINEQRKTQWVDTESLEHFLDPNDETKTVEGYPAPKRVYIKAKLKPKKPRRPVLMESSNPVKRARKEALYKKADLK